MDGSIIDLQGITQAMQGLRYDSGILSGPEKTDEGYLRCWATIARTGVQTYRRADGTQIVEYRPAEEVGKVDSLASFAGKAVTLEHPPELLNAENTGRYQVGFTDSEILFDGNYVKVRMTITDADAIASVENGMTPEVSAGYQVDLEHRSGVSPEGDRYDAIQRAIVGNHVALTRKGRAGSTVKVHLDSADAIAVPNELDSPGQTPMAQIEIGGVEFEVSEAVAIAYVTSQRDFLSAHQAELTASEQARTVLEDSCNELQANLDALTGTCDELKARVDSLSTELEEAKASRVDSTVDIDALVNARLALISKAQPMLDSEFDFTGKTERDIQEAVIRAVHGDSIELAERADAYIEARFDAVVELAEHADSTLPLKASVASALREDGGKMSDKKKTARAQYLQDLEDSWQKDAMKSNKTNC